MTVPPPARRAVEPLFRPLLHAGVGLLALTLGLFPRPIALLGASLGIVFNWVVIPRLPMERRLRRRGEPFVAGLRTYPVGVFLLVLLLPASEAAAAWAVLAYGDSSAAIVGSRWRSPPVFGNRKATWAGSGAFLVIGTCAAFGMARAVDGLGRLSGVATGPLPGLPNVAVATLAAVLLDLVRIPPDDNLPTACITGTTLRLVRDVF